MGSGEGKLSGRDPPMPAPPPLRAVYAPETAGRDPPMPAPPPPRAVYAPETAGEGTQGGLSAFLSSESSTNGPLLPPGEGGICERAFSFSERRADETSEEDVSVILDEDEEACEDEELREDSPDVAAGVPGRSRSERLGGVFLRYATLAREAFVYCSVMVRVLRRKVTRLAPLRRLRWVYGVLATKLQGRQWPPPAPGVPRPHVSLEKKQV